jgi:hypothetical protein
MVKRIIIVVFCAAIIGVLALCVDVIPARAMTVTAMTETFVRISLYAQQNNDIPPSLDVLPRRSGYANQTTDGWRRPLKYETTPDGIIRLTSLGKDGVPGGTGDDTDVSRAYYARCPDGSLWVTSEMWIVEAEVRGENTQQEAGGKPCKSSAEQD